MKKIALACLAALALLSGTGCEKIIEFKGEQTEPRLTVSAQAEVGKPLEAFLASSIFFLADTRDGKAFIEKLDTAKGRVCCYVNGAKTPHVMEWQPKEGEPHLHYLSDYVPAPGDHIRVEAEFPGFDSVWAETVVPLMPAFELVSAKSRRMTSADWEWIIDEEDPYFQLEITLALTDDPDRDNYYLLQPVMTADYPYLQEEYVAPFDFSSNDVLFQGINGQGLPDTFGDADHFFTDALIKGQRHVFTITISGLPSSEQLTRFTLHAAAIDESMYWYGQSYKQFGPGLDGLFSEGRPLYTNVHGGYGVVCSAASKWLDVEVDW